MKRIVFVLLVTFTLFSQKLSFEVQGNMNYHLLEKSGVPHTPDFEQSLAEYFMTN